MTVDTTAPLTAIDSGPSALTNAVTISLGFSASEPGSTFNCRLDGPGAAQGTSAPCTPPKVYTGLADGSYTFRVRATDAAGNVGAADATRTFTVDRTAPAAPTVTSAVQVDSTVTLGGAAELGATIEVREGATLVGTVAVDGLGLWTRVLTAVTPGAHTYTVTARDAAGNTSAPTTRTTGLDTTPPETTITSGPTGPTNAATLTFAFGSSESGSTFACRLRPRGRAG